jgi:hypothetical protein
MRQSYTIPRWNGHVNFLIEMVKGIFRAERKARHQWICSERRSNMTTTASKKLRDFTVLVSQRVYYDVSVPATTQEEAEKLVFDYVDDLNKVEVDRDELRVWPEV